MIKLCQKKRFPDVTGLSPSIIQQTNDIVRSAIMRFRISGGDPCERSALYDALNKRRNARAYSMPAWQRAAWHHEIDADLRSYGRVERAHAELAEAVERHRPTNQRQNY